MWQLLRNGHQCGPRLMLLDVLPPDRADYQAPCRYAAEASALGYATCIEANDP